MSKNNVSIEDVARRAKVSISTVSRVINNVATVSIKNRTRVEEAVAHLKYKPNASAQSLARGFTNAIGLVIPGYPGVFHSFYAMELIRGVGHACETLRFDLVFHITNGMNPLNNTNVGGVIFADIIENRKQVESAIAHGTPCMIVNYRADELDASYIAVDNIKGGELAADYLTSLHHKKIATITGNLTTQAAEQRFSGFNKILEGKGISIPKEYIYEGDYSRRSARAGAERLLGLSDRPTAIFTHSDEMALEVITVAMEQGLTVPDDISVVGFDDNPACLYGPVAVTTIKQPLFAMGEDAAKYLHGVITKDVTKKKKSILEPELIIRESCSACRS